jgi:hypothetical protein
MKAEYGAVANFLVIYVREAHPTDEWRMDSNDRAGVALAQPRSDGERCAAATGCAGTTGLTIPIVVDGVDDAVGIAWGAWPDRLYVLDAEGRVLYRSAPGPFGFRPQEVEGVLRRIRDGEATLKR